MSIEMIRYKQENEELISLLRRVKGKNEQKVMVPMGRFAFMEGELSDTSKVTISIGLDYFIEGTIEEGARLDEYESFVSNEKELIVGEELNEDGERMVEIRGEGIFHDQLQTTLPVIPAESITIPFLESEPVDEDDRAFLARLRDLELEEEKEARESALDQEIIVYSTDEEPETAWRPIPVKRSKSVSFSSDVDFTAKPNPIPSKPLQSVVVEHVIDSDEEDGSELESEMVGRDVAIAYHLKRGQLLAAGLIDGVKSEEELYEEMVNAAEKLELQEEEAAAESSRRDP